MMEEAIHKSELPEVDYTIDQYSIIAKFLNSINFKEQVVFSLPEDKFMELHIKIHEQNTGNRFHPRKEIKEFDIVVEGVLFRFIKENNNEK